MSSAKISFIYTIKYPHLVNLSIITRIILYTYPITRSLDFNNFTIKSYNITSYSLLSVFTSYSSLYNLYLLNLFLEQSGYSFIIFFVRFYIFLMIYSSYNLNNFIIKSYNITSYSLPSISTSYSSLYSLYLLNLFF